ncbi:hypothetical protein D3C74_233980 [compost metagenome]
MSKYNFSGNNIIGSVGDNSISINHLNESNSSIDYEMMKKELSELYHHLLQKQSKNKEEVKLQRDIQHLIEIKDKATLLKTIGEKASKLFFDTSISVGAGVLANYIFNFLNH